jgi:hypothetical protein
LMNTDFDDFAEIIVLLSMPKKEWGFTCITHLS